VPAAQNMALVRIATLCRSHTRKGLSSQHHHCLDVNFRPKVFGSAHDLQFHVIEESAPCLVTLNRVNESDLAGSYASRLSLGGVTS
jgi:hypothetical protein